MSGHWRQKAYEFPNCKGKPYKRKENCSGVRSLYGHAGGWETRRGAPGTRRGTRTWCLNTLAANHREIMWTAQTYKDGNVFSSLASCWAWVLGHSGQGNYVICEISCVTPGSGEGKPQGEPQHQRRC